MEERAKDTPRPPATIKSIKFSHRYVKHPYNVQNGSAVTLIEVLNSRFEDLHKSFIEYDTTTVNNKKYSLPRCGDCLVLLFLGRGLSWDTSELFTTVRRSTPENERYYKGLRGKKWWVKIEDKDL